MAEEIGIRDGMETGAGTVMDGKFPITTTLIFIIINRPTVITIIPPLNVQRGTPQDSDADMELLKYVLKKSWQRT